MPVSKEFGNVQDLVDIKDIRESTVIMRSGGMRQILMVGGINFSLKSEDEQNIITQAYQNFLNSVDFQLQIIVHSRKINIERYLNKLDEIKEKEVSPLVQNQINEYKEFVRGFIKDNPIMTKSFFIVVPYSPLNISMPTTTDSSFLSGLPFFGKKDAAEQKKAVDDRAASEKASFDESVLQLKQRVQQVAQGLSAIGLESVVLNDEQLVELFYNFYNPETVEKQEVVVKK